MVTTYSVKSVECDVDKTEVWQLPPIGRFLDGAWPDHPGVERIHKDGNVSEADASV